MFKNFLDTLDAKLDSMAAKVVDKLYEESDLDALVWPGPGTIERIDTPTALVFTKDHTCIRGDKGGLITWNRNGRASYVNQKTGKLYSFEQGPAGQLRQAEAERRLIEAGVQRPE